jgi:NitT/TauT family transport system substrate-binding protein
LAVTLEAVKRVLLCIFLLTACNRPASEVRLALQPPSTNNYPSYFAQSLGYFKDEGLNVSISQIAGAAKVLEAVVAGSADVGGGVYEQTLQMKAEGKDLVGFVLLVKSPNFAIVGAPGVKTLADLAGKTVGVSSVGSPSQTYLNYLLAQNGVDPSKVSTATVGMGATAMAALEHAQVDAAVLFGSAITAYTGRHPDAAILADTRTPEGLRAAFHVEEYPASCLLAQKAWLEAHQNEARKMARAEVKALQWLREHSPEEILAKVPSAGDPAAEIEAIRLAKPMYSTDGRISKEGAEAVRGILGLKIEPNGTFSN